ncbi:MAG: ribosome recycling factor [Ruminococcaceae bacterium]|nr:ribosome recycling factor [Oscillospiraceae bacterium]
MKLDVKEFEEKMKKSVSVYEENLAQVRVGKASAAVLQKVSVDYYGTPTPIKDIAQIKAADAHTLTIQPWDMSLLKAVEKAILAANLGMTPQNDGKIIRLVFPQLTEDRRKELSKQVNKMGDDAKVALRNIRREANDKCKALKKDGSMTEDEQKASEKSVQDLTDKYINNIDNITADKVKDIMSL